MKQETKDQLREILCEVPEINGNVKELKKGCEIWVYIFDTDSYVYWTMTWSIKFNIDSDVYELKDYPLHENLQKREYENMEWYDKWYINIIWNPLKRRHLLMYCDYINLYLIITTTWMISYIKKDNEMINTGIKLDNTKDLEDQSEEIGQKLIKFLLDNK